MGWRFEAHSSKERRNAMQEFIAKHHDQIAGTLSGFDRLVFRGTLRSIVHDVGMQHYLRPTTSC
jgi:hypothetical protein